MSCITSTFLLCAAISTAPSLARAQTFTPSVPPPSVAKQAQTETPTHVFVPMHVPALSPEVLELLKLEGQFSADTLKGGGRAFTSWFADDGVTLNNGQPAVRGKAAIAAIATWNPATYKLSWYAEGAQMVSPSNDSGFTWGHYDAVTVAKDGTSSTKTGRYFTFWKKVDGKWKVALDASADEPPFTNGLPTP